jgi:hypothetical protein
MGYNLTPVTRVKWRDIEIKVRLVLDDRKDGTNGACRRKCENRNMHLKFPHRKALTQVTCFN